MAAFTRRFHTNVRDAYMLAGLKKITKAISKNIHCSDQDLNPGPAENVSTATFVYLLILIQMYGVFKISFHSDIVLPKRFVC
jgi:hypothetical protein